MVEDISEQDKNGNNAVHFCCQGKLNETKLKALQILLINGVKRNFKNSKGKTPLKMLSKRDARTLIINSIPLEEKPVLFNHMMQEQKIPVQKCLEVKKAKVSSCFTILYLIQAVLISLVNLWFAKWKSNILSWKFSKFNFFFICRNRSLIEKIFVSAGLYLKNYLYIYLNLLKK